ncbi:MAG TPA: hypothetical protein VH089_17955 [Streptosporangiaceae bacterium]|nr:hypothetical protein [Streptosporangiaceae bacterium]
MSWVPASWRREVTPSFRDLPDSRLDVLNTGHCAWEEDPARYASITADWINRAATP